MTRMTGARALAEMLSAYGVTDIFMVPAVLRRTMAELELHTSIRRIHAHGEKAAAYMADGYARVAGRPGVCMAQVVGAMNLAAGLRDAYLAHSPVIALTGGRDPATKFRKVYQEIDDVPSFEAVTKFNATVDDVARIPDMLRQAFRVSVSGVPGPVHLQFRGNEGQLDQEEADLDPDVSGLPSAIPPYRPRPSEADVRQLVERLQAAARPVIVAGGGVRASGAGAALVALAEALSIPVATSLNGKDAIAGTHPLSIGVCGTYSRGSANRALLEADLVCFIGSETGSMTTHFWRLPAKDAAVLQIDIEAENLGRNYRLDAALLSDARVALELMLACADRSTAPRRGTWLARVRELAAQWRDEMRPLLSSDAMPIRPERICSELSRHAPEDAIMVVDTGHAGMWMGGMYDLRSNRQSYLRSAGHLGWAFPAALGAKCAAPDRPVICFTGDAGFWYHVAEIETALRWGINAVIVVNNNGGGNQSKRGFDRVYGGQQTEQGRALWTFRPTDFAGLAEAIGARGIRVEKAVDFQSALASALATPRLTVIDVVTDIEALAPSAVA